MSRLSSVAIDLQILRVRAGPAHLAHPAQLKPGAVCAAGSGVDPLWLVASFGASARPRPHRQGCSDVGCSDGWSVPRAPALTTEAATALYI